MKIDSKINLGLTAVYIWMIIIGVLAVFYIENEMKNYIGSNLVALAVETADKMDRDIYSLMTSIRGTVYTSLVTLNGIKESNDKMSAIGSEAAIQKYIDEKDKEWISAGKNEITPFMKEIIDNEASGILRRFEGYFEKMRGFNVFGEIFVTNSYGVNAAETGKTSDYRQDDEEWWQVAKKEGIYISDIEYDASSNMHSIAMGAAVKDENSKFLGVLKAVMNLTEAFSIIDGVKDDMRYNSGVIELVDKKGYRWYGVGTSKYLTRGMSGGSTADIVATGKSGFIVERDNDTGRLMLRAFGYSPGFRDYKGLGGAVIIDVDVAEVFSPVAELTRNMIILLIVSLVVIFFIGRLIALTISKPLHRLHKGIEVVSGGNLDYRVGTVASDEVGQLSRAFDYMILKLKATTVSCDELVKEVEERRKVEMELLRLVSIIEHSQDAIIGKTVDGIVFSWNKGAQKIYGYSYDEVKGRSILVVVPPENHDEFNQLMDRVNNGEFIENFETTRIRKDGRKIYVSLTLSPIKSESGDVIGISTIGRDITASRKAQNELRVAYNKLKETQTQLVQASKMASIGMLAGGVAHEVNNPLTGVLNNVQLVKLMVEKGKKASSRELIEIFDAIEESAVRCKKITQSLLSFSRISKGEFKKVSLNEIVDEVLSLIGHEISLENILIKREFAPDIPPVIGDAQLLQQAIFDIINNAEWAIRKNSAKDGGVIDVKTVYDWGHRRAILSISDTGIGIPKENIDRIFEPFFTTKPVGEGTGLGLSIVYNIIKGHNGTIEVESLENRGTMFKITLPVAAEKGEG